ncbi:hypothetical protein [Paremcibacter congregatus]|uniref:Uncharacterized protein n=1 Tax=Paremcibacter congregatus TaxID=2043170 RepID=A0A2G4YUR6_9PROT|nr:hypothetical protein [Paremcibacter congregatus]PHZ86065.1 hypothetical protein CRD36_05185 [Paremcibacter congregatus]QDE27031.1 hypothetical protein FIV45_06960 [Paremcibacter congregatus]
MVNNARIKKNSKEDRLSMRHSLIVWVAGAVLGWVVAVVSVWTALNTTDSNIADSSPSQAEKLEQIMPAAGDQKDKKDN